MKTKKKVLLALLSASCITAGAFGLAACGGGEERNADIESVYNQYVVYAESNGETPLTYEAWLNSIKGQKGDTGATGAAGKSAYELYREAFLAANPTGIPMTESAWIASLTGTDGNGIEKIELNEAQTKLVVTYTDGTSEEVDLPESLVHVHDYGTDYETVIAPTATADGLGYMTCGDCGHYELLVIKPYEVTVYLEDGVTPAEGATVTINEVELETDAEGVARFNDLKLGEYDVNVNLYGYTAVTTPKTGLTKSKYEVVLAKNFESDLDLAMAKVGDKKVYSYSARRYSIWGDFSVREVVIEPAADKYTKYKLTFTDENGEGELIYNDSGSGRDIYRSEATEKEVMEVVVVPGETLELQFTVSMMCNDLSYDYTVEVERLADPALGSFEAPILGKVGEEVSVTAASADDYVYVKYTTKDKGHYKFAYESGVSISVLGSSKTSDGTAVTSTEQIETGTNGEYYSYFVKAKATDGNVVFTMNPHYYAGEQGNTKPLTLDTQNTVTENDIEELGEVWYSFTVDTEKEYTVATTSGSPRYVLYHGVDSLQAEWFETTEVWGETKGVTVNAKTYVKRLPAGTYYFVMEEACEFTFKEYDSATDSGYSKEYLRAITAAGQLTFADEYNMYFEYTVEKDGIFAVAVPIGAYLSPFSGETTYGVVTNFNVYSDNSFTEAKLLFSQADDNKSCEVHQGDVLYISAAANLFGDTHTLNYKVYETAENISNTYVFKDNEGTALGGVVVTVYDSADQQVANETTNANGEVTLSLAYGDYTYTLDFGANADDYVEYSKVELPKAFDEEVAMTVNKLYNFTFTLKLGASAAEAGITVSYGSYSAQTNASGVATLRMPKPAVYTGGDLISVSGIPQGYEFTARMFLEDGVMAYNLTLTPLPITVTLTGETTNLEAKAGNVYKINMSAGDITFTVSSGYIYSFSVAGTGTLVNPDTGLIMEGMLSDVVKSGDNATSITYSSWWGDSLTIMFSADTDVTINFVEDSGW